MKIEKEQKQALEKFEKACDEVLLAQNEVAVKLQIDFSGVYITVYEAREITRTLLKRTIELPF